MKRQGERKKTMREIWKEEALLQSFHAWNVFKKVAGVRWTCRQAHHLSLLSLSLLCLCIKIQWIPLGREWWVMAYQNLVAVTTNQEIWWFRRKNSLIFAVQTHLCDLSVSLRSFLFVSLTLSISSQESPLSVPWFVSHNFQFFCLCSFNFVKCSYAC